MATEPCTTCGGSGIVTEDMFDDVVYVVTDANGQQLKTFGNSATMSVFLQRDPTYSYHTVLRSELEEENEEEVTEAVAEEPEEEVEEVVAEEEVAEEAPKKSKFKKGKKA